MKLKIAALGSTRGTDLQAVMDAISMHELEAEIVLVASDRKDAYILERAENAGLRTFRVDYRGSNSKADAEKVLVSELKASGAQLVLLVGFMKILTPYFIREFRGRIWNVHPSLLPKYAAGMDMSVHEQVLANNEAESGCTLHEVDEGVDTGRIIMQKICSIEPGESVQSLKEKVQSLEQQCLVEGIRMACEGKIKLGDSLKSL